MYSLASRQLLRWQIYDSDASLICIVPFDRICFQSSFNSYIPESELVVGIHPKRPNANRPRLPSRTATSTQVPGLLSYFPVAATICLKYNCRAKKSTSFRLLYKLKV
jgi:hypothetical protein